MLSAAALLLLLSVSAARAACPGPVASGLCFWTGQFEAEHDSAAIICADTFRYGSLALVRDDASNAAVRALTTGRPALIGLDRRTAGQFYWADYEPLGYAHWAAGQPEDDLLNCVLANTDGEGGWGVASCTQTLPFVCSAPAEEV